MIPIPVFADKSIEVRTDERDGKGPREYEDAVLEGRREGRHDCDRNATIYSTCFASGWIVS
jgi:hypothetical protein